MKLRRRLIDVGLNPRSSLTSLRVFPDTLILRCTQIPLDITELFVLPHPASTSHPTTKQFYTLLSALHKYTTSVPPYTLPLSATLPDMRASTQEYIRLQTMYKARALEEKATFVGILKGLEGGDVLAGQGEV